MSDSNKVILRYRVWYDLSIHFVTRGLEFHQQLSRNSFQFLIDDDGIEYVALSHETKQKNWQGGLDHHEAPHDKRMYATGDTRCPVASLRELLERTPAEATSLFNHCSKEALASLQSMNIFGMLPNIANSVSFRSSYPTTRHFTNFWMFTILHSGLSPKHGNTGFE